MASPRLLSVYADRPRDVEQTPDLRPANVGSNVALLTPFAHVVFGRTLAKNGITLVALVVVVFRP